MNFKTFFCLLGGLLFQINSVHSYGALYKTSDVVDLGVGYGSACFLFSTETRCLGFNYFNASADAQGYRKAKNIFMGMYSTCVQGSKGLQCSGSNSDQQLDFPVFNGLVSKVTFGSRHACVLFQKKVFCYGHNGFNQLDVPQDLENVIDIEAGGLTTCAQLESGGIQCWGFATSNVTFDFSKVSLFGFSFDGRWCGIIDDILDCRSNTFGQFQRKIKDPLLAQKVLVTNSQVCVSYIDQSVECFDRQGNNILSQSGVLKIASGWDHICYLTPNAFDCVGDNKLLLPTNLPPLKSLTLGRWSTCYIDDSDNINCLGVMGTSLPVKPTEGYEKPKLVDGTDRHMCAIYDEEIRCWGRDMGGATTPPYRFPGMTGLLTSKDFSCAYNEKEIYCWGFKSNLNPHKIKKINKAVASETAICVLESGSAKCWNESGEKILENLSLLRDIVDINAAYDSVCVTRVINGTKSKLECYNSFRDEFLPNPKDMSFADITQVSIGSGHFCVIDAGVLKCWDYFGEYFDVPTHQEVKQVVSGFSYSCAITSLDEIKCLNHDHPDAAVVTQLPQFGFTPKKLYAGSGHVCAEGSNGQLECWGGSNQFREASVPKQIFDDIQ